MAASGGVTARDVFEERRLLERDVIAARVDGDLYDLHTPLPEGVEDVRPVHASEPDALPIIRHSSAHVMADAVQRLFPGTKVAFGPPTDNGFYYDLDRPDGTFSDEDLRRIERKMEEIIAQDHPFRREEVSREEARRLMEEKGERYKLEHLDELEGPIYIYRHGGWVDLCEGPHVPSTRFLKAFQLTNISGAYWHGDESQPMLQRVYGTAFGSKDELDRYLQRLEEARQRDHRKLGRELELVAFHPMAPASPFFLPRGATVYNLVCDYIRRLYVQYGYEEVITPQVYDNALFYTSGHLPSFGDNLFFAASHEDLERAAGKLAESGETETSALVGELREAMRYGVKSMNCPGHCLMFGMTRRSYRDLPMRIADFGRLHRYERSGVVQGLTRVRTFSQDDAHVFCTMAQMQDEIVRFVDLVYQVYEDFGFTDVRLIVATRPEQRLGSDEVWDRAENALTDAVRAKGLPYDLAEGEGAHYGPKIEFHLKDALDRPWQLGTIQVDFNLPERFELSYIGEDNDFHRPVMLHRAILGSVERFLGLLIEHCGGAFPTWLAPEQVTLLTVSEKFNEYAEQVRAQLQEAGIRVTTDFSEDKLGAKIRQARLMRIPYLAVIGQKEVDQGGVALRSRDEGRDLGLFSLQELVDRLREEGVPPSERNR